MKLARLSSVLLIAILLGIVGNVFAQTDDTTPVTFNDGVTMYYPKGWEKITDDNKVTSLQNDETGLYVFLYSLYDLDNTDIQPGDTSAMLEYYHNQNRTDASETFDAANTTTVTVGEREITYFEPLIVEDDGNQYRTLRGVMVLDETGRMVTFGAYPLNGETLTTPAEDIFSIIVTAQTGVYYLTDGTSFTYPATWDSYVDDSGYIRLDNVDTNIRLDFVSPDTLKELGATEDNLVPVLEDAFSAANNQALTFDATLATPLTAGDFVGMQYQFTDTYQGESYERWIIVTYSPDGWVNLFDVVPNAEATINPDDKTVALEVIASFELPEQ
jgi:hypothetical protein